MKISNSSDVLGTIKKFLTEYCPLDLEKFQLFAVSVYFRQRFYSQRWHILKRNLIYRNIIRTSMSTYVLGTIENFWQELCPLRLRKFPIICSFRSFSSEVAHTEMKIGIQIYHKNIYVKICFGYNCFIKTKKVPIIKTHMQGSCLDEIMFVEKFKLLWRIPWACVWNMYISIIRFAKHIPCLLCTSNISLGPLRCQRSSD